MTGVLSKCLVPKSLTRVRSVLYQWPAGALLKPPSVRRPCCILGWYCASDTSATTLTNAKALEAPERSSRRTVPDAPARNITNALLCERIQESQDRRHYSADGRVVVVGSGSQLTDACVRSSRRPHDPHVLIQRARYRLV